MACLDKCVVSCLDDGVMACLDEGVVECLDNKDNIDVDIRHRLDECFEYFILAPPLEHIIEATLGGQYIFHHGNMEEGGWSETCEPFYHDH